MDEESADAPRPQRSISSVDKALRILEHLAQVDAAGVSLGDLSRELEINKASLHHALTTMRLRGWVEQDEDGRYLLGPTTGLLSQWWQAPTRLVNELHPVLMAITNQSRELSNLGRLSELSIVYLDKVEPARPIRVWSEVGSTSPAVSTAIGRAILGARGVSDDGLEPWLRATPNAGPGFRTRVVRELERVRRNGYSTERDDSERGISCVGVPLDLMGSTAAAISLTMPSTRFSRTRAAELAALVHQQIGAAGIAGVTAAVPFRS